MDADALVSEYLGRLRTAAAALPPGRRDELAAEMADHIETALAEAGARDEAAVRTVLDRLGDPEAIVAAEVEERAPASPTGAAPAAAIVAPAPKTWTVLEILAILLLSAGSVMIPLVGPLIGIALAWVSPRWTMREKAIASLLLLVMFSLFLAPRLFLADGAL